MKFVVEINTDNSAFENGHNEISRILREVADKVEQGHPQGPTRDINGNTVGYFNYQ